MNGITFHSIKEGQRYAILRLLEKGGEISQLRVQVPFTIMVCNKKVCTYKADFTYYDRSGKYVVEDTKGALTPVYKLKKKLLFITQGIQIKEV